MSRPRIGFWYRFAAVIVKPWLIVLFKRDWRGMENIPAEGGFITAINHNSYLDPLSYAHFQYNTGRVPRFLAKDGLFKNFFVGTILRGTGQIPVYRESADAASAFEAAVEAINSGECVAFYPEGTLTRDPGLWPMQGKTGVARVALLTRAPVVPLAQWGANEVMPPYARQRKLRLWPRKTLKVIAGPPIDLSAYYDLEATAENLRIVTDVIMNAIAGLLAELRGEPAPAKRYDPRTAREQVAAKTARERERERESGHRRSNPGTVQEPREAGVDATEATEAMEATDATDATEATDATKERVKRK